LNVLIRNNGSLKQEIQDTLSISRRSLNNALKIISKDIVNISGDFCKLNIKIDENLISEVTELAFKANSKIYPIKEKYFISIPKILDEKLAKFIGLLITDGHLDDRSVNISGETSNIAEKLLNSVIPHKTRLNMVRSLLRLDVDSKALAQFFNDYFGLPIGKKSQIVRVPKQIFESPTSVRCAFLAGLLEGDGTVIDKICISSTSKFLIEDTIKLLLSLEILSYCKKYNTYNAVVHGGHDSISKFNLLIRPYLELERKKLLLNELAITNKKISTINYPVKEMLHNLRADYKVRLHDNMYRYLSPNTSYNINSNIFGYMIQKLGNIENQFVYEMQRLYNSDLIPCMVESVEEMENDEPMYDLTTTTSNFFAGEIPVVVHNTALDGLKSRGKVIVIAATNRPNAIDPALRRPGRFDRELELNIPKEKGRLEILKIHTRNMPLKQDVKIEELARITHGFVGADLEALCKEAAMVVLRRLLPEIGYKKDEPLTPAVLEKLQVGFEDFIDALKGVRPSALREVFVEIPDIKWDDIGGLDDVKQELKEAVEWPLKHPDKFKLMGVKPPKGVLMYGVPGSGKTLLAKAVAHETESNFILVNGPELLSKFVGESEKAVRKVFEKARQASPVVIFFDEIDAIAPRRGRDNGDSGVTERIVNQLLTEIDGLQELNNVVIIGATNRPDIIDPALLRSGRFDRLIQTPVPDEKTRLEIFKIHMKNMPLSKDVKLDKLVESTKNYVGSDIEAVCRESAIFALRKNMESKEITMKEFSEALKKIGPSVREEDIKKYNIVSNKLRNARAAAMKVSEKELDYFG
jgi:SpoVK/Ycf46/Vps4 family AAA+-type ATPase/intein/homing endonuclease